MAPDAAGRPWSPGPATDGATLSDGAMSGCDKADLHSVADGLLRGDPACLQDGRAHVRRYAEWVLARCRWAGAPLPVSRL